MELQNNEIYKVKVTKILKNGIIVELQNGDTEFIHISEISDDFVSDIKSIVDVNQTIDCKCFYKTKLNKSVLSVKRMHYRSPKPNTNKCNQQYNNLDKMIKEAQKSYEDKTRTKERRSRNRRSAYHAKHKDM